MKLKSGWKGDSETRNPTVASMATRPCVTSASRYLLVSSSDRPDESPRGSNSPSGATAPGSPQQNSVSSGVHPLIVLSRRRPEVQVRVASGATGRRGYRVRRDGRLTSHFAISEGASSAASAGGGGGGCADPAAGAAASAATAGELAHALPKPALREILGRLKAPENGTRTTRTCAL